MKAVAAVQQQRPPIASVVMGIAGWPPWMWAMPKAQTACGIAAGAIARALAARAKRVVRQVLQGARDLLFFNENSFRMRGYQATFRFCGSRPLAAPFYARR